jgi:cysteine-rich repeat protein
LKLENGVHDTMGATAALASSCGGSQPAPGLVFSFDGTSHGLLTVEVTSSADLGISAFGACGGSEVGCTNGATGVERLEVPVRAAQSVLIAVTGYGPGDQGSFILSTSFKQAECGDGKLDPDEQCDDGGRDSGDGCTSTCTLERCANPPPLSVGSPVTGTLTGPSLTTAKCANRLSGPEAVFSFTATAAGPYRFTATPTAHIDLTLSLGSDCGGASEACADDGFAGSAEATSASFGAGETRFVVVEGWGVPDVGGFTLEVGPNG